MGTLRCPLYDRDKKRNMGFRLADIIISAELYDYELDISHLPRRRKPLSLKLLSLKWPLTFIHII